MEEEFQIDLSIYKAISVLTEYNEEKQNSQHEKWIKQHVADWEQQCKIYNRNIKTYSKNQQKRELEKLNNSRPSQYDFAIARGKTTFIHHKSSEVLKAEKLLERVRSQINNVLN